MLKYIDEIKAYSGLVSKYPTGGSRGFYNNELIPLLNTVKQGNAIRLFFILVEATDDYNVVRQPRERWSYALGIKHDNANIGKLLENLMSVKLVVYYGREIVVNPMIVLPSVKEPKLKSVMQEWWSCNVEFQ